MSSDLDSVGCLPRGGTAGSCWASNLTGSDQIQILFLDALQQNHRALMNKTKLSKFPEDMIRPFSKKQVRVIADFLTQAMSTIGYWNISTVHKKTTVN